MNIGCVVGNNSGSTAVRPEVTSISPDSGEGVYDAPWDVGKKPLASAFLSLKGDEFARSGLSRRSFDPGQHPTVSVSDKSTPGVQMGNSSPRIKSRKSEESGTTCHCANLSKQQTCHHSSSNSSSKLQYLKTLQSQPPCGLTAQRLLQQQRCQSPLQVTNLTSSPKNSGNFCGTKSVASGSEPASTDIWKQRTKENEEESQGQYDIPWDLKNKVTRGRNADNSIRQQNNRCCNGHIPAESQSSSPTVRPAQSTIAVQTDSAITKRPNSVKDRQTPASGNSSPQLSISSNPPSVKVKQKKKAPLPPEKPSKPIVDIDNGEVYDEPWDQSKQNRDLLKVLKSKCSTTGVNSGLNSSFTSDSGHPSPTSSSLSSSGHSCDDNLPRSQTISPIQATARLSPSVPLNKPKLIATNNGGPPVLETAFCCKSAVPMNAAVASNNIREVKYTEEERKERKIQQLCHGVVSDEEFGCEKLTRNRRAKEANKPPRSHQKTESCRHHSVSPVVVPKPAARQRKLTAEAAENASPEMVSLSIAERKRLLVANMSDLPSGANWVKPDMAPVVAANASSPPTLQSTTTAEVYDAPWEFSASGAQLSQLAAEQKGVLLKRNSPELKALTPDLNNMRAKLKLNLGCGALNPTADKIDVRLPIEKQQWFHGAISRCEAERRLANTNEGAYLVRICEGNKEEFALSLKSAKGFMHMKMQQNPDQKWILGYFSQPFDDISSMIRYYSVNKLPIKGAEHMCLLKPIIDQLL